MRSLVAWSMTLGFSWIVLAGCGGNNPAQTDDPMAANPSLNTDASNLYGSNTLATPYPVLSTSPVSTGSTVTTPSLPIATASTTPIATATLAPSPIPTANPTPPPPSPPLALRASVANQKSKGLLMFQRLEVTPRVQNPSWLKSQAGMLIVTFLHKGHNVGTLTRPVVLQPAEIRDYDAITSEKPADSVTVSVVTD